MILCLYDSISFPKLIIKNIAINNSVSLRNNPLAELFIEQELEEKNKSFLLIISFSDIISDIHIIRDTGDKTNVYIDNLNHCPDDFEEVYLFRYFAETDLNISATEENLSQIYLPEKYAQKDNRIKVLKLEINPDIIESEIFQEIFTDIENEVYKKGRNQLEYRLGINFDKNTALRTLAEEASMCLENDLKIYQLRSFITKYKKYLEIEKKIDYFWGFEKDTENIDKDLELLMLYSEFLEYGKLPIFYKLYDGILDDKTLVKKFTKLYNELQNKNYNWWSKYKFIKYDPPLLHILRTKNEFWEIYNIKNVTLKIDFPFALIEHTQYTNIYSFVINWAMNPGMYISVDTDSDTYKLRTHGSLDNLSPICKFYYHDKLLKFPCLSLFCCFRNSNTKLRKRSQINGIDINNLDSNFVQQPPGKLSELTIEVTGDLGYRMLY